MISIIISKIPLHVYLLIHLGRHVNSEIHMFYKLLCTLQYGRPQQPLHTINPHPISTPWNICPMVNVIPHVVGQTVPVKRQQSVWVAAPSDEVHSTQGLLEVRQGSQGLGRVGETRESRGVQSLQD